MDAIDFIESDIRRSNPRSPLPKFFFALGIACIPVGLGLLLREDENGVFDPRILIPNLLAAFGVFGVAWVLGTHGLLKRRALNLILPIAILALFLSTDRIFFPVGERTTYLSGAVFWNESLRCITKGALVSLLFFIWLGIFSFFCTSIPTRSRRAMIGIISGIAGVTMLGFHCDSSSVAHVLVAHIGQGVAAGLIAFLFQRLTLSFLLNRSLPWLRRRIGSISKIG